MGIYQPPSPEAATPSKPHYYVVMQQGEGIYIRSQCPHTTIMMLSSNLHCKSQSTVSRRPSPAGRRSRGLLGEEGEHGRGLLGPSNTVTGKR
jgi:hypothetical protein